MQCFFKYMLNYKSHDLSNKPEQELLFLLQTDKKRYNLSTSSHCNTNLNVLQQEREDSFRDEEQVDAGTDRHHAMCIRVCVLALRELEALCTNSESQSIDTNCI